MKAALQKCIHGIDLKMAKTTRNKNGYHNNGGKYAHPFGTKRKSIFAHRTHQRDISNPHGVTVWTPIKVYQASRFVTYKQVTYFARRKWIAVTSCKSRLYVCELCPDQINYHLQFGCV
jgi:predicted NUDIX family NTP pyrophosphohydrolase